VCRAQGSLLDGLLQIVDLGSNFLEFFGVRDDLRVEVPVGQVRPLRSQKFLKIIFSDGALRHGPSFHN